MPKLGERKCPSCEEFSPTEDWRFGELSKREICYGCYESDCEHASTLVRYTSEGKEAVRFGDDIAHETEYGEDPPSWFWNIFEARNYIRTDGWRGHYQTTFNNGFVKLASGWVTGWPDETVSHKRVACDLSGWLGEEENLLDLPAPIYWLFDPTSNVFSLASDIFVKSEDREAIEGWLRALGFESEAIKDSFN